MSSMGVWGRNRVRGMPYFSALSSAFGVRPPFLLTLPPNISSPPPPPRLHLPPRLTTLDLSGNRLAKHGPNPCPPLPLTLDLSALTF